MKQARLFSLVALAMTLAACSVASNAPSDDRFPDTAYTEFFAGTSPLAVELRTAPSQPPDRGVMAIQLVVRDASGRARDDLTIDVTAFMGAHGHGAAGRPVVTSLGEGRYRIDELELSMPGFWQLLFTIHGEGMDARATTTLEVR